VVRCLVSVDEFGCSYLTGSANSFVFSSVLSFIRLLGHRRHCTPWIVLRAEVAACASLRKEVC